MATYEYTEVIYDEGGVILKSTDTEVLNWISVEVQKTVPCKIVLERALISGEPYRIRLHRLSGLDENVAWWVAKQLMQRGWAPISTDKNRFGLYFDRRLQ